MDYRNKLIKNAFDFLNRSIDILEDYPKYSIIFFATSLELFVKAKLAEEHWTLIIENPTKANISKLRSGSFKSVSLSEGIDRIENILDERFSKKQLDLFKTISDHRNRIIHFYHKDYFQQSKDKRVQNALRDLSEGWYYLSSILNKKWSFISSEFSSQMDEVEKKLETKGHLLKGKFYSLSDVFKKQKEQGKEVYTCKVCSFKSAISTTLAENLIECNCPVCESDYKTIIIACPKCGSSIFTEEFREGECGNCGHFIEFSDLIEKFAPPQRRHDVYLDTPAFCTVCEHVNKSVVEIGQEYVCVNCFSCFNEIDQCDYCGAFCSGSIENSYLSGCVMCDGKLGDLTME